jgi:hypothetical protein
MYPRLVNPRLVNPRTEEGRDQDVGTNVPREKCISVNPWRTAAGERKSDRARVTVGREAH